MSEPWKDPIVEEIREFRRQIENQFGDDLHRMLAHYQEKERRNPEKYVTLQPRRIEKGAA